MSLSKSFMIYLLSRLFCVSGRHTRLFKCTINRPQWSCVQWIEQMASLWFSFAAEQDVEAYDYMEIPLAEESDTSIKFSYQSNGEMIGLLKATEERCPQIARTYSIGRSMEGSDLLVIEFSNNPGQHELREFAQPQHGRFPINTPKAITTPDCGCDL